MTVRILTGDVRERLAELPDESVQCCVTSPPYYGLRDYGTASWDGGDPDCDHQQGRPGAGRADGIVDERSQRNRDGVGAYGRECRKCGAVRVDRQIGLEPTLAEYIATLVAVFREVRRVLRDDGTVWLNLGDSYNSSMGKGRGNGVWFDGGAPRDLGPTRQEITTDNLKPKDLMMVPARVALALQDDGWWLRSDIIWAKKNCMPESVTDRPTSSHEHIFLLTKSARYYYDAEAVREEAEPSSIARINQATFDEQTGGPKDYRNGVNGSRSMRQTLENFAANPGRNQRNVWHLATEPFPEAHFATFPTEIPRRCIKAGTSEKGQCSACGAPWVRVVKKNGGTIGKSWHNHEDDLGRGQRGGDIGNVAADAWRNGNYRIETTGWQPSCTCDAGDPVPQAVLDPFLGSGTTLLVADQLGRHGVGIELNPEYAAMAEKRIRGDAPMFAQVDRLEGVVR